MIYAIGMGEEGPVKFGVAETPEKRLRELQTGNPSKLKLLVTVDLDDALERVVHAWHIADRLEGEWFKRSQRVEEAIKQLKERALSGKPRTDWFVFRKPRVLADNAYDMVLLGG